MCPSSCTAASSLPTTALPRPLRLPPVTQSFGSGLRRSSYTTLGNSLRALGIHTTEVNSPVRFHAEGRSLKQHLEAYCCKHNLARERSRDSGSCCSGGSAVVSDLAVNQCQGSSVRRQRRLAPNAFSVAPFRTTRAARHHRALLAPQALD